MPLLEKFGNTSYQNSAITKIYKVRVWSETNFVQLELMSGKYKEVDLVAMNWKLFLTVDISKIDFFFFSWSPLYIRYFSIHSDENHKTEASEFLKMVLIVDQKMKNFGDYGAKFQLSSKVSRRNP